MTGNDDGGKTPHELNRDTAIVVALILLMFALPFIPAWLP